MVDNVLNVKTVGKYTHDHPTIDKLERSAWVQGLTSILHWMVCHVGYNWSYTHKIDISPLAKGGPVCIFRSPKFLLKFV